MPHIQYAYFKCQEADYSGLLSLLLKLFGSCIFMGAQTYPRASTSQVPQQLEDEVSLSLPVTLNYLLRSGATPEREAEVNPARC